MTIDHSGDYRSTRKINSFKNDLPYSNARRDKPWWEACYCAFFPTFKAMRSVDNDLDGVDRIITLQNNREIRIDEKCRRESYDDVLLEFWSVKERRRRGWVAKDLTVEFIAYAWEPKAQCLLLPFDLLRLAWKKHFRVWVKVYGTKLALNDEVSRTGEYYNTESCPVPISVLLPALHNVISCHWTKTSDGFVATIDRVSK